MHRISDDDLRRQFIGWQCRIRQIAMRQHGGRPSPGMMPQALSKTGDVIMDSLTVLLVPDDAERFTKFFRFQVQKSPDPKQSYDAAMKLFQGDYFQQPDTFSDVLAAQFAPASETAQKLLKGGDCILQFDQFSQTWKLNCTIGELPQSDPAREHVLAHNRMFNRNIPSDAMVLAFAPHWHSANADPVPVGA